VVPWVRFVVWRVPVAWLEGLESGGGGVPEWGGVGEMEDGRGVRRGGLSKGGGRTSGRREAARRKAASRKAEEGECRVEGRLW
jgi:hypothetical protein